MDNKDNKLAVEKIAKKLDKFKLDEVVMILELEENEVKNILDTLIEENIIIQNDDTYFYSKTKNKKTIQYSKNDYVEEIVLEELEGYDEYLKLKPCHKKIVDKRLKLIRLVNNVLGEDFNKTIDLYNAQHPNDTVGYSTATVYRNQFRNYGLRGLFPKIRGPKDSAVVDTIYETFKKYYLNTNKFSTEIALKLAQNELQNDGKIAFPLVHNAKSFYNKLIKELGKPSIEHLKNTAEFIIPDENKEVVTPSYKIIDITFKEAAANYLKNLSKLKKEERLLSEKTSYKNQIAYYFDDYKINEITPDVLRKYKQEKYNSGYSVSSVKTYLTLVKSIITHACPYKEQMAKQLEILSAIDMNILDKSQIEKLLSLAKREFKWGYPIIRLGLLSGANVPEILALQWENVFFSEKRIHISKFLHSGKIVKHRGNSPFRNLTIDDETVKTLAELFIKQIPSKEDFVFKMNDIDDINKYFEESILKPISEKLELGEFNSIDLTHNFVNMLLTQNVPITYIRKVCGYPSIKTFLEVYNSRLQEREKEYYNPLDMK